MAAAAVAGYCAKHHLCKGEDGIPTNDPSTLITDAVLLSRKILREKNHPLEFGPPRGGIRDYRRLREFSAKHAGTAQENQAIVVPGIDPTLWLSGLASWRTHTQQRNGGGRASGGILAQHFMSDLKQAGRLRFRNQRRYTYGMRFLRRQHVAESTEKNDRNAGHLQV